MTIYVDQNAGRKGEPKNRHGDGQNSTHSTSAGSIGVLCQHDYVEKKTFWVGILQE